MSKGILATVLLTGALLFYSDLPPAGAATTPVMSDQEVQLLKQDLRAKKLLIIAQNVPLTDEESKKFWPLYDQYTAETIKLNDRRFALIKEYADNYLSLSDAEAKTLMKNWLDADGAAVQLRLKYIPIFEKAIPAKKIARFMQIDRRLGLALDLQISSQLPLVLQ
jgi:hypothetical protein